MARPAASTMGLGCALRSSQAARSRIRFRPACAATLVPTPTSTSMPSWTRRAQSSSAFSGITPVELAHDLVQPAKHKTGTEGQCMVICHGLFGSKQNWRSLAKAFAHRLGMPVYTLDLRNHGTSPHVEPHTYAAMASDIAHFVRAQGLEHINLVGHSMGGKAVMAYALNDEFNRPLRSLVSVDMSPAIGKISPEFAEYTAGMQRVNDAHVRSKAEADTILASVEPVLATRQFLLTNTRTDPSTGHLVFRIPIDLLARAIPHIGDFPHALPDKGGPTWDGPTLFLKGEHSKYLNKYNIPAARAYFPRMRLETLDAGHWVHAEQPAETVRLVSEFIEQGK